MDFLPSDTLFAPKGAKIEYFDPDGVLAFECPLPLGRVEAAGYIVPHYTARVSVGVVVVGKPSGYGVIDNPLAYESGANPDFTPSSAAYQEEKLRKIIDSRTAELVNKAVAAAVAAAPPLLIEQQPAPQPAPQSEPAPQPAPQADPAPQAADVKPALP